MMVFKSKFTMARFDNGHRKLPGLAPSTTTIASRKTIFSLSNDFIKLVLIASRHPLRGMQWIRGSLILPIVFRSE
jgi:hypothetical protein